MKGLVRFALIWAVSMLLAPYLERFLARLVASAPKGSLVHEVVEALRDEQSATLIRSFGETIGDLAFGPSSKGRGAK